MSSSKGYFRKQATLSRTNGSSCWLCFFLLLLPSIFSTWEQSNFLASSFHLSFLKGIHIPSLERVAVLNWKTLKKDSIPQEEWFLRLPKLLKLEQNWRCNGPISSCKIPFWKGKITSYLFWLCMKTCLKCCQFDQILDCQHFLNGKKNAMTAWATGPPEAAAISIPKSHLHVNCSKRTKVGWWRLNLEKYAMGPLSGQVLVPRRWQCQTHAKGTSRGKCLFWHSDPCPRAYSQGTHPSFRSAFSRGHQRTLNWVTHPATWVTHPPTWIMHGHKNTGLRGNWVIVWVKMSENKEGEVEMLLRINWALRRVSGGRSAPPGHRTRHPEAIWTKPQ